MQSKIELPEAQRAEAERGRAGLQRMAYSYSETGQLLGLSDSSVRRCVQSGQLRAVKLNGGRVVITADSIAALLAGGGIGA